MLPVTQSETQFHKKGPSSFSVEKGMDHVGFFSGLGNHLSCAGSRRFPLRSLEGLLRVLQGTAHPAEVLRIGVLQVGREQQDGQLLLPVSRKIRKPNAELKAGVAGELRNTKPVLFWLKGLYAPKGPRERRLWFVLSRVASCALARTWPRGQRPARPSWRFGRDPTDWRRTKALGLSSPFFPGILPWLLQRETNFPTIFAYCGLVVGNQIH